MRRYIFKFIFYLICVGIGWYALFQWSSALPQYKNEALFIPTFFLYVITFPISLIYQVIYTVLSSMAGLFDFGTSILNWIFYTWIALVALGHIQWFFLFPWLFKFWCKKKQ